MVNPLQVFALAPFIWSQWASFDFEPPYVWDRSDNRQKTISFNGVNTMSQFEGNIFLMLGTCFNGPRSRVAKDQKTPTATKRRAPMPKTARVWLLNTSLTAVTQNGWVWWFSRGWHCTIFKNNGCRFMYNYLSMDWHFCLLLSIFEGIFLWNKILGYTIIWNTV